MHYKWLLQVVIKSITNAYKHYVWLLQALHMVITSITDDFYKYGYYKYCFLCMYSSKKCFL